MYCAQCGHEISADAIFCSNCGHAVSAGEGQPSYDYGQAEGRARPRKARSRRKRALRIGGIPILIAVAAYVCIYIYYGDAVNDVSTSILHENGFPNLTVKQVNYGLTAPLNSQSTASLLVTNGTKLIRVKVSVDGNPLYSGSTYVHLGSAQMFKIRMQF